MPNKQNSFGLFYVFMYIYVVLQENWKKIFELQTISINFPNYILKKKVGEKA